VGAFEPAEPTTVTVTHVCIRSAPTSKRVCIRSAPSS